MAKSWNAECKVMDWLLGGSSPSRPAAQYLALCTADPTGAGGLNEVTGYGYARQAITFNAASTVSGTSSTSNSSVHTFTAVGGGWGAISYWAIYDALTGGNEIYSGAATVTRTIASGESLTVAAAAITVSES